MKKQPERGAFRKDKRGKHHHWAVTLFYADGEKFQRVYIDLRKTRRFAERQLKSPIIAKATVRPRP